MKDVNFTLLQKTLLHEKYLNLQNLSQLKFFLTFENDNRLILILIYVLQFEKKTKKKMSDYKMILSKIKIPCDRYFSCSKFFCNKVKFKLLYTIEKFH